MSGRVPRGGHRIEFYHSAKIVVLLFDVVRSNKLIVKSGISKAQGDANGKAMAFVLR